MSLPLLESGQVRLALREIAGAREHLRLASEILSGAEEVMGEGASADEGEPRLLELGGAPHDLLGMAHGIIQRVFPQRLAQRARQHGASPRDWLHGVYLLSCAPRNIKEPVATLAVMLAAVKFGLRHQLLLQTETRLGLAHKSPIRHLDPFLEIFIAEMTAADSGDVRLNDWLKRMIAEHYPNFGKSKRFELPSGDYFIIPDEIAPMVQGAQGQASNLTISSPIDAKSPTIIPARGGWQIPLGYGRKLDNAKYPAYHGRYHSGIDIARYGCFGAPVHAMRAGVVIDAAYLPRGFGNTVVIEHDDGTCLRYTHLDKALVKAGDGVPRGQQIGTIGKGAKDIYAAHLHLDMPRSRVYARAGTYYDTIAEVAERFINPLSQIPAGV